MQATELPTINLESIIALASSIVVVIAWLIRMEGGVKASKDRNQELCVYIEKVEKRVEKLEERHEKIYNELRGMLLEIQKSLSLLEGRLYSNSRVRDRDRDRIE